MFGGWQLLWVKDSVRRMSALSDNMTRVLEISAEQSVGAIKEIGTTIGRISEIASIIAAAVEEQSATTQEISRSIHAASQSTGQVATKIGEVKRGASETGSASSQVLTSARRGRPTQSRG